MSALRETADPAEDRAVGLGAPVPAEISMMLEAKASDPMMFGGSQSPAFSRRRETHDLLTLAS